MSELDIVLSAGKKFGIDEALVIYTSKVDLRDWVNVQCRFGCKFFGNNWSCPPQSIPVEQTRNLLREYTKAVLIIGDNGEMDLRKFRKGMLEIERALKLNNYHKALAMSMGPCDICDKCTILKGEPCAYPEEKRPSIEGTGIDIIGTVKKFKKNINPIHKRFFSFGLVLLE